MKKTHNVWRGKPGKRRKRNEWRLTGLAVALLLCLLAGMLPQAVRPAEAAAETENPIVEELAGCIDGILTWKQKDNGASDLQALVDQTFAVQAGQGNTEWYVIALAGYRTDLRYDAYLAALEAYLAANAARLRATDWQKCGLAYLAAGGTPAKLRDIWQESEPGGVMSKVFGLLFLDASGDHEGVDEALAALLSVRLADGGWAIGGTTSDTDVTAMAVQALAPYQNRENVARATTEALALLSARQLATGEYQSFGTRNPESAAQVLMALCALRINCFTDSRFIKSENTLLDGMFLYETKAGGFAHTLGGNANDMASAQVLYSFVALWRYAKGESFLYAYADYGTKYPIPTLPSHLKHAAQTPTKAPTKPPTKAPTQALTQAATETPTKPLTQSLTPTSMPMQTPGVTLVPTLTLSAIPTQAWAQTPMATQPPTQTMTPQATPTTEASVNGDKTSEKVGETVSPGGEHAGDAGSEAKTQTKNEWRVWLGLAVLLAAGGVTAYLVFRKTVTQMRLILVWGLAIAALLLIWFLRIERPEDYYKTPEGEVSADTPTVRLSISCEKALGKGNLDFLPEDGYFLSETAFSFTEGDTVFSLLEEAAKQYQILLEYEGITSNYVTGIGSLYEFDCGDLSGWMYLVNGVISTAACSDYTLSAGDVVEWVYTLDLGNDIEAKKE